MHEEAKVAKLRDSEWAVRPQPSKVGAGERRVWTGKTKQKLNFTSIKVNCTCVTRRKGNIRIKNKNRQRPVAECIMCMFEEYEWATACLKFRTCVNAPLGASCVACG